jgi:NADPH-dependent glutamate synthase beta subunit-like oxidoreductase
MESNLLTSLSDNIRIDREKCSACGRCVEVCILDNLRLQLAPCRQACPVNMNCQGYVHHLAQGKFDKGLEKVREGAPFARTLGRVCSRPCEASCNRVKVDGEAVAIRDLKRFLADEGGIRAPVAAVPELPETVAIVGAGPAGLTAAFYLRTAGFKVTLYDRESAPGGLLRWAIPEFRLPLAVLEEELHFLEIMGVEFHGNRTLGEDLSLSELEMTFDALLLSPGAYGQARLGIPGEESPHVIPVLDFLKKVRQNETPDPGHSVIVIGGGNAAIDAAQTALRTGVEKVTLVCLEKENEMTAFPWSVAEAREEGITVENGWGPHSLQFDQEKLSGVTFKRCTALCDETGCFCPEYDVETLMQLPCDTVIVAIGQKTDRGLPGSPWPEGGVRCDPLTLQTVNPKVFLAGDFAAGPGSVVEAMGQAKQAAISIERMLKGQDLRYERGQEGPFESRFEPDWERARKGARVRMTTLPVPERRGFDEVRKGFSREEATTEAGRCLNCGVPFGIRTCWFCLPCEIECPEEALYVEIPYLLR